MRDRAGSTKLLRAASGITPQYAWSLFPDETGHIWIGTSTSVLRWQPGSKASYPVAGLDSNGNVEGVLALTSDRLGAVLVGVAKAGPGRGLQRLAEGRFTPLLLPGFDSSTLQVYSLLLDRDEALWIGAADGLYRLYNKRVEHFTVTDGLSGAIVWGLLQDHEGNIWAVTNGGIDNFRDVPVVTLTDRPDFHPKEVDAVTSRPDGTLWVGGVEALYALKPGTHDFIPQAGALRDIQVSNLFGDAEHRMWVGTDDRLNTLDHGQLSPISMEDGTPVGMIVSMAEDRGHGIWAVTLGPPRRVLRIDPERRRAVAVDGLPPASKVTADPQAGIWLGLVDGDIARYRDSKVETFHSNDDSPPARVKQLVTENDGAVLASTSFGLFGWKDGRVGVMSTRNGLPCNELLATVTDAAGNLWLYLRCGLAQITASELRRWWQDPALRLHPKILDKADGAHPGEAPFSGAARTPDGRLWFATGESLQMFDPGLPTANPVAPPVAIDAVIADEQIYAALPTLTIGPQIHTVTINYTAPSFVAPQKIRFRYRLVGFDKNWNEVGTRRQAVYTQLPPGHYHFQVTAYDDDRTSNPPTASLDLSVLPAFYQTLWFEGVCVVAALAAGWLAFRARVRESAKRMQLRYEARLAERERIARQIHDTFLQSVQAFMLHLSVVTERLGRHQEPRPIVDELLEMSEGVAAEVRHGIHGLRELRQHEGGIAEALTDLGRSLVSHKPIQLKIATVGTARELVADVYENIYAIGQEAILNAINHAQASEIRIEVHFSRARLRLCVSDNGRGIDSAVLAHGREGHWGLVGMRERARVMGARFVILSNAKAGTEVVLRVPAGVAFARKLPRLRSD